MKIIDARFNYKRKPTTFENYQDLESHIVKSLREWWSFDQNKEFRVRLVGRDDESNTLGICVNDSIDSMDILR